MHMGKLKHLPDYGGNRTRNLWFASPMLYQLSDMVMSVRIGDISKSQFSSFNISVQYIPIMFMIASVFEKS